MALDVLSLVEDDDDDASWARTQEVCADCGARIRFTDEIFLIQVVQAQTVNGKVELYPLQDDEGEYRYSPHLVHIECWENVDEGIKETMQDEPPLLCEGAVLECSICASSILAWEHFGIIALGEMQLSPRRPSNESSVVFTENGHPEPICLACLVLINLQEIELWDTVTQSGECENCTQERCWRTAGCSCDCHFESSGSPV